MAADIEAFQQSVTTEKSGRFRRVPYLVPALALLGLLAGFLIGSGHLQRTAFLVFDAVAQAQYRNYLASNNLDADGRAEFLVWLDDATEQALDSFLSARPEWETRESSLPGWEVFSSPANAHQPKQLLQQQSFAKVVLRNRGVWLCH